MVEAEPENGARKRGVSDTPTKKKSTTPRKPRTKKATVPTKTGEEVEKTKAKRAATPRKPRAKKAVAPVEEDVEEPATPKRRKQVEALENEIGDLSLENLSMSSPMSNRSGSRSILGLDTSRSNLNLLSLGRSPKGNENMPFKPVERPTRSRLRTTMTPEEEGEDLFGALGDASRANITVTPPEEHQDEDMDIWANAGMEVSSLLSISIANPHQIRV